MHVLLKGLLDLKEEKGRLRKAINKIAKELEASNKKLGNKGFLEKAPSDIVEKVREKAEAMKAKMDKLIKNLEFFEAMDD